MGTGISRAAAFVAALAMLSCEPLPPDPQPAAPSNACPEHPCAAYAQNGDAPACTAGVCAVPGSPPDVLLVVAEPTDTQGGPGHTWLLALTTPVVSSVDGCDVPACDGGTCALALTTSESDEYVINFSAANEAHWYLGNPTLPTTLPVAATFRPLYGADLDDAIDLGLPLDPVAAVRSTMPLAAYPGPNGSPAFEYETYLAPGCYERTAQPYAPLSSAFPPEIEVWQPGGQGIVSVTNAFDTTNEEIFPAGEGTPWPSFDIARAEGLEGWTAYLRNVANGRVYSNVVALSGSLASGVTLLTNHTNHMTNRAVPDALTGLELVVAPPAGAALPTITFAPTGLMGAQELPARETYPSLPTPVTMTGRIATTSDQAVPATIVFTATDITDKDGNVYPPNFEFATQVKTADDGTYSALLPRGHYQMAVRPSDGQHAVKVVPIGVGQQGDVTTGQNVDVVPLLPVSGVVTVADGRALAAAVVEAVPTACASTEEGGAAPTDATPACLPAGAQTVTTDLGAFQLDLDPGTYRLVVQPAQGTHLPWVAETLLVTSSLSSMPEDIVVPAPIVVSATLQDESTPPKVVPQALVRAFTKPTAGSPPVELGQAVTDANGHFELDLTPPN